MDWYDKDDRSRAASASAMWLVERLYGSSDGEEDDNDDGDGGGIICAGSNGAWPKTLAAAVAKMCVRGVDNAKCAVVLVLLLLLLCSAESSAWAMLVVVFVRDCHWSDSEPVLPLLVDQ
jgi:hypothetical protein